MITDQKARFTIVYTDADGYFFEHTTIATDAEDARRQLDEVAGRENNDGVMLGMVEMVIATIQHEPAGPDMVDQDRDLVLKENDHCWITVRNASVRVNDTGEGVVVDIYPADAEDAESDASTYSFFTDLEAHSSVA